MLFDPFVYHGMADMHDRHRDMRLDVDNMSYEVRKDKWFFQLEILLVSVPLIQMIGISGIVGFGRTHWRCEHWTERGYHFWVNETAKICYCNRIPARLRTMLYMSGMSSICLYVAVWEKKKREKRITRLSFFSSKPFSFSFSYN